MPETESDQEHETRENEMSDKDLNETRFCDLSDEEQRKRFIHLVDSAC